MTVTTPPEMLVVSERRRSGKTTRQTAEEGNRPQVGHGAAYAATWWLWQMKAARAQ
jgi:hypothetical protein